MPYISLDNLTQYNGRLRDYIDGSFDKLDGANWRKTSAAQSVSCWPIPESPLEPEVAFKFSEVLPESGTKGPDNPSTIVGVESVSCNVCESEGVYDTPYSIDLGGTYYGGTVNFATGVMEVTWGKYVFDGSITATLQTNEVYRNSDSAGIYIGNNALVNNGINIAAIEFSISCDRLPVVTSSTGGSNFNSGPESIYKSIGGSLMFRISNSRLASYGYTYETSANVDAANAFKAWLADNPVTMIYQLAEPVTVPLTPVLVRSLPALSHYAPRQNTIYTPHESVQVGYAKSASKTSQDLANAIVALGGNV